MIAFSTQQIKKIWSRKMSNSNSLASFALHYPNMRMGRFLLKAGERIPIHIHAGQFGLAYLLQGKCVLTTYIVEAINDEEVFLTLDSKQTLTADSYSVITPQNNGHQIDAIEDCVFLDVFAPGQSEGKLSDYLEIIKSEQNGSRLIGRKIAAEEVDLPESLKNCHANYTEIV
jgi:hypothetical protein